MDTQIPNVHKQELRRIIRQVLPPHGSNRKLYSSVLAAHVETTHKVLIRSRLNQAPEMIKDLLK